MGQNNNRKRKGGKRRRRNDRGVVDSSAAALGSKIARNSGLQGVSLLISNLLHAVSVLYVARRLGPGDLGVYTLLLFLSGSITQVFHIFSKPGTLRRVFGQADDEDAGAEGDFDSGEDETQSETPQKSLGVGIAWVGLLGLVGATLTILLRTWIAGWLLGDPNRADLVLWAGILGGVGAIFKLTEIVIWFEGKGWTYVIVDATRPILNLVFMAYLINAQGMGVKGAIVGAAIGTSIATIVSFVPLVRSFEPAFEAREVGLIVRRGIGRVPIATSMFAIQNADGFLLSRFVDHKQLGYYQFAQKLGFIVSFLPQGFRIALRPLRKTAMFQAVRDQYGSAVAKGQLLTYFLLISIFAILAMVLGGELLIHVASASSQYQAAAPLIPLTAAMMTMPALFRTVNGQSFFPHKRAYFIGCVMFAAASFVGWMFLLVPLIGIAGTPIASILAFGIPSLFLFTKNQLGKGKIDLRYGAILGAVALASAVAVFFHFVHPANKWLQLAQVGLLLVLYVWLLFVTGIVPRIHRRALLQVARGMISKAPPGFNRSKGLGALKPEQREKLRAALVERIPAEALASAVRRGGGGGNGAGDGAFVGSMAFAGNGAGYEHPSAAPMTTRQRVALVTRRRAPIADVTITAKQAANLVRLLRRVGRQGGARIAPRGEWDARIAKFLFADSPVAARNATMRGLVAAGADSVDLHKLDELAQYLAKSPKSVWEGGRRRRRVPVNVPVRLRRR